MSYIALRDFDSFKKGDTIPEELVEDRLIRGRKIGLVESEVSEVVLITEVVEPIIEEILLEDSSAVEVKIEEEIVRETIVKEPKKSKK